MSQRFGLIGVVTVALVLSAAALFGVHWHFMTSEYARQIDQTVKLARTIDAQAIERLRGAASSLARFPLVLQTALGERAVDDAETLLILETTRANFNASIVYVMNARGLVVACTPYDEGKTLTGKNYAFRPYFIEAMKGDVVLYPALGVTTLERGFYTSAPIPESGPEPAGVFVIKSGLESVDHILADVGEPAALVSPEGVVFASNRPEWLFHLSRSSLSEEERARLRKSQQFADQPLEGLPGGWDLSKSFVTLDGERHGVARAPVAIVEPDGRSWELLTVRNFQTSYPSALMIAVAVIIAAMTIVLGLYLGGRRIRTELQRETAANREYLATTLDSIGDAVIACNIRGDVRHMNPAAERLTGRSAAEAVGKPVTEVCCTTDDLSSERIADPLGRGFETGEAVVWPYPVTLVAADGSERSIVQSVAPIRDETGTVSGAVMVLTDVTARVQGEKALRREKEVLQTILDNIPVMVTFLDAEGRYRWVSRCWESNLGWSFEEALETDVLAHAYPDPAQHKAMVDFIAWASGVWGDFRTTARDGRVLDTAWASVRLSDGSGIGIGIDITERKRVEKALSESESRYRTLFERTDNPVLVIDTVGNYVDANEAGLRFLECSRDELMTKSFKDFLPPGYNTEVITKLRDLWQTGGRIEREYAIHGKLKSLDLTITPVVWRGKEAIVAVGTDLTLRKAAEEERLRLERQLQQMQKAESLGRMASAIAHHFNNLLGVVMGNLELALLRLPRESIARANLAKAMTASARAVEISRLMRTYLGQRTGATESFALAELCRETMPFLGALLPEKVRLNVELPEAEIIIQADAVQVRQILTNLVANAGEAMGDQEGEVTVAVGVTAAADIGASRFFPPEWKPEEERYACLSVSDTGGGIDKETEKKLFDPFFSTKFTGRGLGLSVVLGVVKAHQGAIAIDSNPGRGTVFRVFLPLLLEHSPEVL